MTKVDFKLLEDNEPKAIIFDTETDVIRYLGREAWGGGTPESIKAKAKLIGAKGNLLALSEEELEDLYNGAYSATHHELDAWYRHIMSRSLKTLGDKIAQVAQMRKDTH